MVVIPIPYVHFKKDWFSSPFFYQNVSRETLEENFNIRINVSRETF